MISGRLACVVFSIGCIAGCSGSVGSIPVEPNPQATAGSCRGVPLDPIGRGKVYEVPAGASDLVTKCQILASLSAGAFIVAYGSEAGFVDAALGANPALSTAQYEVEANGTPDPHVTNEPIPSPLPSATPGTPTPTPLPSPSAGPVVAAAFSVAAFVRVDGVLQTFEADADTKADLEDALLAWELNPVADGPTPPPANKVWTLIGSNRQEVVGPHQAWGPLHPAIPTGTLNLLTDVWRLSTNDRTEDYFMVGTVMSSTPNYFQGPNNACYPTCRYWTWERHQLISLVPFYGPKATTEDIGPKNHIQVDKVSFEVGANLAGKIGFSGDKGASGEGNAGISAKYGVTWEQPHATTITRSNVGSQIAQWQDNTLNFMSGIGYDFLAYRNTTTVANFTNGRVAIFKLPRTPVNPYILPDLTNYFLVRGSSCLIITPFISCDPPLTFRAAYQEIHITSTQTWPVMMPTFSVSTTELRLKPLHEATFRIRLRENVGENSKSWQIVTDPSGSALLVTPHSGNGSDDEYVTITVKAQPNAVPGTTYTLYVNTVPAGGASSLRYGSIRVRVDIV